MSPALRRWALVLGAPTLAVLLLSLLAGQPREVIDESWYLPVIAEFTRGWDLELFRNYHGHAASPGQLFFVVYGVWARLTSPELPALRWASRLLSIPACALVAVWIARLRGAERRRDAGLALALPYVLLCSQLVMTEPLALLLTAGNLLAFGEGARTGARRWWWIAGGCLLGALFVRSQLLALGAAQLAYLALARERRAAPWLAVLLPLAARGAGFWFWGGLATEASRALTVAHPEAGLTPSHLGYLLMWAGAFTWPAALRERPRSRLELGVLGGAALLYLVCLPPFTKPLYMGLTIALVERSGLPPLAVALAATPLAAAGGLGLLRIGRTAWAEPAQRSVLLALLALAGILLGSHHLFDRYLLYAFLTAVALVEAQSRGEGWVDRAWCGFLGGLIAVDAVHALHHLR